MVSGVLQICDGPMTYGLGERGCQSAIQFSGEAHAVAGLALSCAH